MADYPKFDLLDTPNPGESSVVITCEVDNIRQAQMPVVDVTTYAQFDAGDRSRVDEYGTYVYKFRTKPGAGLLSFTFVKVKTPTERNTQILPTYIITEDIDWLAVVPWIEFYADYNAPLSQNTADSAGRDATVIIPATRVLRSYIHSQNLKTTVKVREFLSDVRWPESLIESDQPMGTEISWDKPGNHGTTGRCLHDEKTVTGDAGPGTVITSAGSEASGGSGVPSQYFPRTNHIDWQDFVTNDVKPVNGQFHRIEKTYIAPPMPEPSVIVS